MPPRQGQRFSNYSNHVAVLNVAEKPSVARSLAGVFNGMPQSRDLGMRREAAQIFTHDNVIFPHVYSQGQGQALPINSNGVSHKMITTSVRGHLASIEFTPEYGWSRCDPIELFEAPLETIYRQDMQPLERMLTRIAKDVQAVILWLDCDREGEAIAAEVSEVCAKSNPRLQPFIYRARFSTVLAPEIRRALHSLARLNDYFVQAVQARTQLDLRVGAAFTRFQTLRLQRKFHVSESVISYGPCQFPTLGFVVERWARIETFVPEDFWFLELTLQIPNNSNNNNNVDNDNDSSDPATNNNNNSHNNNEEQPSRQQQQQQRQRRRQQSSSSNHGRPIVFTWKRTRLYDRIMTLVLYESCLDAGMAVVTQLTGRPKNKWRPIPLATVELQKRASRYLRIGSESLMSAAEELYQQGYISYPRTETERFSPEFQHQALLQDLGNVPGQFGTYTNHLLAGGFQNPRAGPNDDKAHPPITPCKAVDPNSIPDPLQRGVYTLVVKHYLACCSRDAIGKETSITVRIASEEFTAKGLMIIEKNWLEIYEPWERWSTGQGELPRVEVGSEIEPTSLLMKDGRTTPPQPISEVELISLMDRNGIGTDATIAQHISTIQEREYAVKDASQRFLPTPLGIALVEGYNSMGYQLNKPDLRRDMEHECNLVANGHKTKDQIVGPILAKMKECFITATAEAYKLDEAVGRRFPRIGVGNEHTTVLQANFSECGTCRSRMTLKQENARRSNNNNNNNRNQMRRKLLFCNTCQAGWGLPRGGLVPKTQQDNGIGPPVKCPICNFQVLNIVRGDGYNGNGYHVCPKCFNDSPQEHGGTGGGNGDFRCFSCRHPTCSLAGGTQGGDIDVFPCPFCRPNQGGKITLRKNSRGYVLSCCNYSGRTKCSYTIWLPSASQTVSVPADNENICRNCSINGRTVRKVHFVWKNGSYPPHLDRTCTVCVLCDMAFRQNFRVSLPQPNQVGVNPRRRTNGVRVGQAPAGNSRRNNSSNNN